MAKKFDAKAKAKRQKIIAAVLGVLLLGVLAYEVPSVMKSMNKKPPAPVAAPAPVVGTPIAGSPLTADPAVPVAATTLSDSDPLAQAGTGQLLSFDRFSSKDPFVQQVDSTATACDLDPTSGLAPTCTPATPTAPAQTVKPTQPKQQPAAPSVPTPAAAPTAARISVNGTSELVDLSKTFPSSDPVFRLVALTRTTAKIGIAGGSLSSGDGTTTLTKGKKVTLMNTADGTRYELVLVKIY
jgi:hypothetical protein